MTTAGTAFFVGPEHQPDKYRLAAQEGGGGEATLWRAEVTVAGEPETVAVKVLRPEHASEIDEISARWAEQAELLRFITHPGVIGVREHFHGAPLHPPGTVSSPADAGERSLYLVMNWADGQALRDWLLLHPGAQGTVAALRLLAQVADALDMLHSGATPSRRPVVHGDLSPGNIIITEQGQAVLVDFGLVRLANHRTRRAAGTPGFAAPEIWSHGEYSPASDRYSFAALAFFALCGIAPPTDPAAVREQLFAHPLLAHTPTAAVEAIMRGFSLDPAQRPETAREWLDQLRGGASSSMRVPTLSDSEPGASRDGLLPAEMPSIHTNAAPPRPRRRRRTARTAALTAGVLAAAAIATTVALAGAGHAPGATDSSGTAAGSPPAAASVPVTVRRHSGTTPLTLSSYYNADLDTQTPNWDVARTYSQPTVSDIGYLGNEDEPGQLSADAGSADLAAVTGAPSYGSCAAATGYTTTVATTPGAEFCVRTSERRYAYLRVRSQNAEAVTLDVVVWDPPFTIN